jgi:hypothetical protein
MLLKGVHVKNGSKPRERERKMDRLKLGKRERGRSLSPFVAVVIGNIMQRA